MFIVLGLENCGYCIKAKALLDGDSLEYEYLDAREAIKLDPYKRFNDEELLNKTSKGRISVPIIFKKTEDDVEYIGGYDELVKYID